ncbi:MAG: GNAT family N-acetyltransferase [Candidatus Omnitrophota bacterium]|nr:GNAT family N-acetyltransferase [Candidatus Omnitrophota bacterium]
MIVSKRHKKLSLKTRVVKKITDIPADDWNKVYPKVLEGYDFYKTLDEIGMDQFSLFYIAVYDRKTPVAATVCFIMNYPLDTSINGPLRRVTNSIRKVLPNIFSLKAVICGMPMGQGKIGIAGDTDMVMKVILRRLEQVAKKNRAPIVAFKDFDQNQTKFLDPLKKKGFTRFDSLPTTMLNIWYKDFEEYMMTLSSASRYDLRRKFKKVDGRVNFDLKIADTVDDGTLQEVYKLYLDIVAKHDMGFELLPIGFFKNIPVNMPGQTKYFLWKIDGKLVMFLFGLVSEDMFIDYYVGFDYSVTHKYHLYFIKFRETLNWCIKNGIKQYEMGITGYEPKRRLGFDFVPLYIYVKLRNRALRPAFNFICQFLKFENFDPSLKKGKKQRSI